MLAFTSDMVRLYCAAAQAPAHSRWGPAPEPFTAHVRRMRIELDPAQYPGADGELVYERARHQGPHVNELTVRRAPVICGSSARGHVGP